MKQKNKNKLPESHIALPHASVSAVGHHRVAVIVAAFIAFSASAWLIVGFVVSASLTTWSSAVGDIALPAVSQAAATEQTSIQGARLLDGVRVDPGETARWPVGVMIENLPSVRPQAGLGNAVVVYEAHAEGGSTRFLAIFDPQRLDTEKIGPVRSARPYYIEWLSEYDGLYAHAGGSPKALTVIREERIRNLEALSADGKYFWRDRTQFAPHNLYTSSELLSFALRDKELQTQAASYIPWMFADGKNLDQRGEDGKRLTFNFSSGLSYKVSWQYQRQSNSYVRFNADTEHTDANTGKQIDAQNVIVQLVEEPELDGTGKGRLDIYVGGTGEAWVAQNGEVIKATWGKASRTDRTRFYDSDGKEIEFVRGKTWIHVLPKTQPVVVE